MSMGPVAPQKWADVRIPVDSANDFVVAPLSRLPGNPVAATAVARWKAATADQQVKWATAYTDALTAADADPAKVAPGDYGPVPEMTSALLEMARDGVLDSDLVSGEPSFYQTDYTRPMLFMADGGYLDDLAGAQHLHGDQWGMMNETGNFPGLQRLAGRESGGPDPALPAVGLPRGHLPLQAGGQVLLVRPALGAGPLGQPGHGLAQRGRLQRPGQERHLGRHVPGRPGRTGGGTRGGAPGHWPASDEGVDRSLVR
jgi:hypothetical protein